MYGFSIEERVKTLDTPQLREIYRKFRESTTSLITDYRNSDFDEDVRGEMVSLEMEPTPRNWVIAASKWADQILTEAAEVEEDDYARMELDPSDSDY